MKKYISQYNGKWITVRDNSSWRSSYCLVESLEGDDTCYLDVKFSYAIDCGRYTFCNNSSAWGFRNIESIRVVDISEVRGVLNNADLIKFNCDFPNVNPTKVNFDNAISDLESMLIKINKPIEQKSILVKQQKAIV